MQRFFTALAVVLVAASGAGVAYATTRQAASDQYGGSTVIGGGTTTGNTVTGAGSGTTTTPPTTTTGTTTTGTTGTTTTGTTTTGTTGTTTSTASTGTTTASTTTAPITVGAGPVLPDVVLIDFGLATGKVRADIRKAVALTGLRSLEARLTRQRLDAFLASPTLDRLSPDGRRAAGRALGAQLVTNSSLAQQAFAALFPGVTSSPVKRAVLSRRASLTSAQTSFVMGVAEGLRSSGIALAYAERSKGKSFAKSFQKLGILSVKDVDTATGQLRLARILLGQLTNQKAVNAVKTKKTSAAISTDGGSTGSAPWLLLAVLVGAGGVAASGPARRRLTGGRSV